MKAKPAKATTKRPAKKTSKPKPKPRRKPTPEPEPDDLDEIRLVRHDANAVVVGGFASLEVAAWCDPIAILTDPVLQLAGVLELGKTPTVRGLVDEYVQACGRARDGRWAMVLGLQKKHRYVRVYSTKLDATQGLDLDMGRSVLEFANVGFVGDRVIALPGSLGTHRRYSYNFKSPQQPYLQEDRKLIPAPGVKPGDEGKAYDLHGVVACAGKRDLVVWGGRIFELVDGKLERTTGFDLATNHNNVGLTTAPSPTGFFTISDSRLVEVVPGASAARVVIADKWFRLVRPGPGKTLILEAAHDTAEQSRLWSYDPASDQATPVATPEGVYPMTVFYSASRKALAMQASTNEGTAGRTIVLMPYSPHVRYERVRT